MIHSFSRIALQKGAAVGPLIHQKWCHIYIMLHE